MSEVRVKVVAENQTKTGFQAALNDAKAFGREATKAATPGGAGGGEGVRRALKGLGTDLAAASTPAEAFQAVATRVASAFGKVTAVIGGFAVGQIIAGQFNKLSEGVAGSTKNLQEFNSNYAAVANATTMDAAISGFDQLQQSVKTAQASLSALQSDFGAVIANALTGGAAFSEMGAAIKSMGNAAASALSGSAALQLKQAEERKAVMGSGGKEAADRLAITQAREQEQAALQERLKSTDLQFGDQRLLIRNAMDDNNRRYGTEEQMGAQAAAQTAAKAASSLQDANMSPAELLRKRQEQIAGLEAKQKPLAGAALLAGGDASSLMGSEGRYVDDAKKFYELETQILNLRKESQKIEEAIAATKRKTAEAEQEKEKAAKTKAEEKRATTLRSAQEQAAANEKAARTPQEQMDFEMQGLADLEGFSGPGVELEKQQAISRIMALQGQMGKEGALTGTSGASGLQRIGFASSESFDARRREDPNKETKKAAEAAKSILEILKKGGPINLPATS